MPSLASIIREKIHLVHNWNPNQMLSEPDEWRFAYNYLTDVTGALMFDYQYNFSVWVFFFRLSLQWLETNKTDFKSYARQVQAEYKDELFNPEFSGQLALFTDTYRNAVSKQIPF